MKSEANRAKILFSYIKDVLIRQTWARFENEVGKNLQSKAEFCGLRNPLQSAAQSTGPSRFSAAIATYFGFALAFSC